MRTIQAISALSLLAGAIGAMGCGSGATGAGGSGGSGGSATATTSNTSATQASSGSAMAECGPDFFAGDACHTCGEASCCAEKKACGKDADCTAFSDCFSACAPSNHTCIQACAAASNAPTTKASLELRACLIGNCAPSCGLDQLVCGGLAGKALACDTCALANCCAEVTARNTSAGALTFLACANECSANPGDVTLWDCLHACRAANPAGAVLVDAAQFCQLEKCPACGSGECAGPSSLAIGECSACQSAKCCAESTACNVDGRCFAEGKACIQHCAFTDVDCVRACGDQNPEAIGPLGAVYACALDQCQTECFAGLGGAAVCGAIGYFDPPTCGTCLETSCCTDGLACKEDATCGALAYCVANCTDAACASACEAQFPGAAALWTPYKACRTSTCATECGF